MRVSLSALAAFAALANSAVAAPITVSEPLLVNSIALGGAGGIKVGQSGLLSYTFDDSKLTAGTGTIACTSLATCTAAGLTALDVKFNTFNSTLSQITSLTAVFDGGAQANSFVADFSNGYDFTLSNGDTAPTYTLESTIARTNVVTGSVQAVPAPSVLAAFGAALCGLVLRRRRAV
jgi:hypothetical protein